MRKPKIDMRISEVNILYVREKTRYLKNRIKKNFITFKNFNLNWTIFALLLNFGFIFSFAFIWYLGSYKNLDVFNLLSFHSAEPPGNIVVSQIETVGVHTFGDYLLPHNWAEAPNPWNNSIIPVNTYPPLSIMIFKLFTYFSYKIGLSLFLLIMFAFMALPFTYEILKSKKIENTLWLLPLVLSTGVITTIDRGNTIGYLVLLYYVYLKFQGTKLENLACISLALMISIKIFPAVLLLILLSKRKYLSIVKTVFYAILINILAVFPWRQYFSSNWQIYFDRIFNYADGIDNGRNPYNVSFYHVLLKLLDHFYTKEQTNSNPVAVNPIFYMAVIALIAIFVVVAAKVQPVFVIFMVTSLLWIFPSVQFKYVTVLILAPLAITIRNKSFFNLGTRLVSYSLSDKVCEFMLLLSIFTTITPFIIPNKDSTENLWNSISTLSWVAFLINLFVISLIRQISFWRNQYAN